jgi:hypothetical protein
MLANLEEARQWMSRASWRAVEEYPEAPENSRLFAHYTITMRLKILIATSSSDLQDCDRLRRHEDLS